MRYLIIEILSMRNMLILKCLNTGNIITYKANDDILVYKTFEIGQTIEVIRKTSSYLVKMVA